MSAEESGSIHCNRCGNWFTVGEKTYKVQSTVEGDIEELKQSIIGLSDALEEVEGNLSEKIRELEETVRKLRRDLHDVKINTARIG
jgi:hypothetical protein